MEGEAEESNNGGWVTGCFCCRGMERGEKERPIYTILSQPTNLAVPRAFVRLFPIIWRDKFKRT